MEAKKEKGFKETLKIRDLLSIFKKRKWWSIGVFIVILVIGMLFTFIRIPVYETSSFLKFAGVYYDENLYKYYPEEAEALGIFAPGMDIDELESSVLSGISKSFRDDDFLESVVEELDMGMSAEEVENTFNIFLDGGNLVINVVNNYTDSAGAYKINKTLIDTFIESSESSKTDMIDSLIQSIDLQADDIKEQLDAAENEIYRESEMAILTDLLEIKYNLEKNRDTFIHNIEISTEPSQPAEPVNSGYLKNILLIIFCAAAAGIIAAFIPNIFKPFKEDNI